MPGYEFFRVQQHAGVTAVVLVNPDELRGLLLAQLQDELLAFVRSEQPARLLVDFSQVEFCSSSVIDALIRLKKRCVEMGAPLKLCCMTPQVREVFQVLNLDGPVFEIYDSAADARAAF